MPSFTLVDAVLTYRLEAPNAEGAVRLWAEEALGGNVAVGPVGPGQYMAAQMSPFGRGEFALVNVRPGGQLQPVSRRGRRRMATDAIRVAA